MKAEQAKTRPFIDIINVLLQRKPNLVIKELLKRIGLKNIVIDKIVAVLWDDELIEK